MITYKPFSSAHFIHIYNSDGSVWGRKGVVVSPVSPNTKLEEGCVMLENGIWEMWYSEGGWGITDVHVNYATSTDWLNWTLYAGNPILTNYHRNSILKHNGIYYMYAVPGVGANPSLEDQFDLLTSSDGINFILDTAAVLQVEGGEWDAYAIFNRHVWIEGSTWYMIYEGWDGYEDTITLGLATSVDGYGRVWTKYSGNPIIWHSAGTLGNPFVRKVGSHYYLWAHSEDTLNMQIYRIRSLDLIAWEEYPSAAVFKRKGTDEGQSTGFAVCDPKFIEYNNKVYMFYTGHPNTNPNSLSKIKLAIAYMPIEDLILTQEDNV